MPDHKLTVLIVDDDDLVRGAASAMLAFEGFVPFEVKDASAALSFMQNTFLFDVVFTDIDMPGPIDGLEFAAAVQKDWPDTAILITSGGNHPETNRMPVGAQFIRKPYSRSQLVRSLERLLTSPLRGHEQRAGVENSR